MPRLGNLLASSISRADVRALIDKIDAPVLANQVLAAASAIFSWGMKQDLVLNNPCRGVERNRTKSRERVLSDSELPLFWQAFDDAGLVRSSALKLILLTGQRPGEVSHMRHEHIRDGWWELPGDPVPNLNWPGTKNGATHRVWLPVVAQALIAEAGTSGGCGKLAGIMQAICAKLGIADKVTPRPAEDILEQGNRARLRPRRHEPRHQSQGGRHRRRLRPARLRGREQADHGGRGRRDHAAGRGARAKWQRGAPEGLTGVRTPKATLTFP
jgi:integrase